MASIFDTLKGIGREMLHLESENTNTEKERIIQTDQNGNSELINQAGMTIENKHKDNIIK